MSDTEHVTQKMSKQKRDTKDTTTLSSMSSDGTSHWTFLTNHAQVLLSIANDPDIRLRDVAETVGITERAAQRIVVDLAEAGFLERERHGRRNRYRINERTEMRHPAQEGYEIGELLDLLREVRSRRNRERQAAN
jgi:DNA-binding MarR family transcriptional regulator